MIRHHPGDEFLATPGGRPASPGAGVARGGPSGALRRMPRSLAHAAGAGRRAARGVRSASRRSGCLGTYPRTHRCTGRSSGRAAGRISGSAVAGAAGRHAVAPRTARLSCDTWRWMGPGLRLSRVTLPHAIRMQRCSCCGSARVAICRATPTAVPSLPRCCAAVSTMAGNVSAQAISTPRMKACTISRLSSRTRSACALPTSGHRCASMGASPR